ncbi:MAG: methionyl-tRNA formyltransferase [Lachnospiraceae bacterium]|nr:methionyl-tRNA formyltransferase [Lachnospiraceae bacterium]
MKIVFMGTPDFAASALEALIQAGHEITLVVTQPDKPKGRSKELMPSPVKVCAMKYDLPVFQPVRIKRPEAIEELKRYEADIFVVAAFGQILSQEILDMPKYGSVNIHASLLPKYRGASPIQSVIIDGEEKTGVTIMQMDAGIDTGDMLYKKEVVIEDTDNFETLHDKLAAVGAEAIVEALPLLEAGKLVGEKQNDAESSHVTMITKEMGKLDFTKDAVVLDRLIRGMNPWPSAFTFYKGKQLKVWEAHVEDVPTAVACGEVAEVTKNEIKVATEKGLLCITSLQLEGKKRMSTHDFLLGVKVAEGDKLG